jgi:hypothetical protein
LVSGLGLVLGLVAPFNAKPKPYQNTQTHEKDGGSLKILLKIAN